MIVLNQLRYQDELRDYEDLNVPETKKLSEKEIELATTLINQLTYKFNPKEYKDTYINELKKIIDEKAKGHKVKPHGKAPKATTSTNLMTLLKQSMKKKAA